MRERGILVRRIAGGAFGLLVLAASPWLLWSLSVSGFRDGMRDVQRAMYPIEWLLTWGVIALAVAAVLLAIRWPRALTGGPFLAALGLWIVGFVAAWRYDLYLRTFLDHGQGG